jgi:hypothetical protein
LRSITWAFSLSALSVQRTRMRDDDSGVAVTLVGMAGRCSGARPVS